jgi:uncharacterized protein
MNPIQKAAFLLDLAGLKSRPLSKETIGGALLSVCSAHEADPKRQLAVIRYLKSKGADVNETDKNGVTPLHRAVRFRSPAAVLALLKLGADIDAQDRKSHSTALHRAVTHTGAPGTKAKGEEIKAILRALIQSGADTRIKNKMGKKPIEYVKDEELMKIFKTKKGKPAV